MEEITTSTLNQKKEEPAREKKEAVVTASSRTKKEKSKFLSSLFSVDDVTNIKDYILYDCVIPAVKSTVTDLIENTVSMIFYGDTRGSRRTRTSGSSRVSYADYYNNGKRESSSRGPSSRMSKVEADEIGFDSRADVMRIRDLILEDLERYKRLTIAEFYDFCEQTASITDNRYGWTIDMADEIMRLNKDSAIRMNRHGKYVINMPPAIPMD